MTECDAESAPQKSPWLTRDELAARLRIEPATVKFWATKGTGPRYAKFGRHVRYHIDWVLEWEAGQEKRAAS